MNELTENLWAVISERGCEADGLLHAEAARLARRLTGEKVSGVCVVTNDAAGRLTRAAQISSNGKKPAAKKATRAKRTQKR